MMGNIKVVIDNNGSGEVQLFDNDIKAGKMDIAITNGKLTVFHTEVSPEFEGRGFAKVLLNQLVSYAKANELKIIPLCPYVNLQFRRHPAEYEDVWDRA
jgi:predicted GNAT family acetyltransferase